MYAAGWLAADAMIYSAKWWGAQPTRENVPEAEFAKKL
jgi:hypothetical protein